MTTDTVPKVATASVGGARIVGVAKGVGMIEPNMATLITLLFTDALVAADDLDSIFRRTMDRTFNCVSIDTDTSTSDTAIVLASGAAGRGRSRRVRARPVRRRRLADEAGGTRR